MFKSAEVAELADAQDLKSCGPNRPYRFDSGPRHHFLYGILSHRLGDVFFYAQNWIFSILQHIARGLDYYTGTVYETVMLDHPEVGSICSGGRYDNLAEYYTDKQLPGVGISIGLTRLFSVLEAQGYLNDALVTAPADVLILPMTEELSPAISFATALRDAGVRAQLHCEKKKFKQKLSYADKLSIPYAAFLGEDEIQQNKVTVKDLTTGQQQTVTAGEAVALVQAGLAARAGGTPIQEPEA